MSISAGRRGFLAASGAALAMPRIARSQGSFPDRPITLIVPAPPGGSSDVTARVLAAVASRRLPHPVVVENRPGASQTLGPLAVARARPDGYVLSQLHASSIRQILLAKLPLDIPTDFTPILQVTAFNTGLIARTGRFPGGWKDFVAEARRRPGEVSYGSTGTNAGPHIGMVLLAERERIELNHIPFRGDADGVSALLGGHVDAMAGSTGIGTAVDAGQATWLNLWSPGRLPRWPDTPTLNELGYIGVVVDLALGIVGPAGLPPDVAARLEEVLGEAARDPEHQAILARYDMTLNLRDRRAYVEFLRETVGTERALIERLHLRAA
ncbi:Bug family tripartite tricarboxylate transporter substrate binding protein [Roseomonas chloroacetimidivorans]|uniref:Bug family tripartite tricarboxylate transporter substrate binding protein n=1 Tax=Roseomonas chloroacetimidivorans TaxID=1766656 RepID=UPI003C72669D